MLNLARRCALRFWSPAAIVEGALTFDHARHRDLLSFVVLNLDFDLLPIEQHFGGRTDHFPQSEREEVSGRVPDHASGFDRLGDTLAESVHIGLLTGLLTTPDGVTQFGNDMRAGRALRQYREVALGWQAVGHADRTTRVGGQ